ncbi:MAG: hypothetical protein ABI325_02980 [Ginsengibacter sp.]
MQEFEIVLKNDKLKLYRNIAKIFLVLNFAVFALLLLYEPYRYTSVAFLIAFVLYLLLRQYLFKKGSVSNILDEFVFFIPAAGWLGMHSYLIGAGCMLMGILYKLSLQDIKFVFGQENIMKMNFPPKKFAWGLLDNVVLKDNILTLDFKTNKLIQAEVEKNDINETDFNSFARLQMNKETIPVVSINSGTKSHR